MTGYGIGEYIRNRRLYKSAVDLKETDDKVIDIAFRYGYETPESFTKAFSRFHGVTPSQVRDGSAGKVFLPLTIKLSVQGGSQMDVKIAPMFPFKVIGFQKVFDNETAYAEIPKFWDEICEKYAYNVYQDQLQVIKAATQLRGKEASTEAWKQTYRLLWAEYHCCYYSCKHLIFTAFNEDADTLHELYELVTEIVSPMSGTPQGFS